MAPIILPMNALMAGGMVGGRGTPGYAAACFSSAAAAVGWSGRWGGGCGCGPALQAAATAAAAAAAAAVA